MRSSSQDRRKISVRDTLLAVQIALCAVLITSSLVAVRGLVLSLHSNFGFDPQNSMLISADLHRAGYSADQIAPMQKHMLDTLAALPGVESVGLTDALPLNDSSQSNVFADNTADLRPSRVAAESYVFHISPEFLRADGTTLLSGRAFTWHDELNSPRVAVVNREFARKIFGSPSNALGGYFKMPDGVGVLVVGVAQDGKYGGLTENPRPAMFLPILQWPAKSAWLVVRSSTGRQHLAAAIRGALHNLDAGLPIVIEARLDEVGGELFPSYMAAVSLGVLGGMGAMLAVTGIFGMAAYAISKRMRELGFALPSVRSAGKSCGRRWDARSNC